MGPRKILFIAEGQLGDLLLLTPAIRATKLSFPSSRISVLIYDRLGGTGGTDSALKECRASEAPGKGTAAVLSCNPHLDEIYTVNRGALRTFRGFSKVSAEFLVISFIRKKKFDTVICTFSDERFTICGFLSGAKTRVGEKGRAFDSLLTHRVDTRMDKSGVLDYYCDLVRAIGVTVESKHTEYVVPDAAQRWAAEFLNYVGIKNSDKLIAVHPGAKGDFKVWPPVRFAGLIDILDRTVEATVLLLSGERDEKVSQEVRARLHTKIIDVRTGNDLGKLGALLQGCSLCISNDSGPRHLAAAVGTPSLAFLRQYHDRYWKIYPESNGHVTLQATSMCPHCPEGKCLDKVPDGEVYGSYCLRMIDIDEAFRRAAKLLQSHSKPLAKSS